MNSPDLSGVKMSQIFESTPNWRRIGVVFDEMRLGTLVLGSISAYEVCLAAGWRAAKWSRCSLPGRVGLKAIPL
jgi:hypothetical protein